MQRADVYMGHWKRRVHYNAASAGLYVLYGDKQVYHPVTLLEQDHMSPSQADIHSRNVSV